MFITAIAQCFVSFSLALLLLRRRLWAFPGAKCLDDISIVCCRYTNIRTFFIYSLPTIFMCWFVLARILISFSANWLLHTDLTFFGFFFSILLVHIPSCDKVLQSGHQHFHFTIIFLLNWFLKMSTLLLFNVESKKLIWFEKRMRKSSYYICKSIYFHLSHRWHCLSSALLRLSLLFCQC